MLNTVLRVKLVVLCRILKKKSIYAFSDELAMKIKSMLNKSGMCLFVLMHDICGKWLPWSLISWLSQLCEFMYRFQALSKPGWWRWSKWFPSQSWLEKKKKKLWWSGWFSGFCQVSFPSHLMTQRSTCMACKFFDDFVNYFQ